MHERDQSASVDSQCRAEQRASQHSFEAIRGWISERDYPGYVEEREKLTLIRHTAPVTMSVKGKNKKMATIVSPVLYNTSSLSGWTDDHPHLPVISSSVWTLRTKKITSKMDLQLPRHPLDNKYKDGWDGKFYASHAEAKLLAFYLDFYTKHSEALHSLSSAMGWDSRILDVNVSDDVCPICLEIARSMYETHQIMVNFTVQGHVVYPKCKNHYCKQKMLDGLRVFCDICRHKISHLPTVCLDLPQMSASQFDELVWGSALHYAPLLEDADFFYDVLEAISGIPSRGLHLYREAALSESKLTVVIPCPRTSELADTIDKCIEDAIQREYRRGEPPRLRARARKAVFNFIESLKIMELTKAMGRLDDFPWKNFVPAPEEAFSGEQSVLSVDNIAHGLGRLLIDDHNSPQSMPLSREDSGNSSDDVNYPFEDEPVCGDTDDEVEEANAADDIIKIIEGDW